MFIALQKLASHSGCLAQQSAASAKRHLSEAPPQQNATSAKCHLSEAPPQRSAEFWKTNKIAKFKNYIYILVHRRRPFSPLKCLVEHFYWGKIRYITVILTRIRRSSFIISQFSISSTMIKFVGSAKSSCDQDNCHNDGYSSRSVQTKPSRKS
jgi:hypothetical protein